ncbi:KpsF/GutQ family sugar-phosphate isomerase [Fusobacterium mortiferum]|uniref:KpsF/GutQ family sugar-phosphate isomerase n=1 Tax=Fusobacterium mortiferum TaxID=850 RepID=A0ABS2G5C5_FUSMR|nr:KpsF/GutQ family sugar-phosphate isomerase [Fusobacterium mortiferum]MBM6876077.1 KpsF/GutQ family sugar-phosphate isomerase [Fusobacterium mortiferum]
MNKIEEAKKVFDIEISALHSTKNILGDSFVKIVDTIYNSTGKLIITGIGKSGHIGKKVASTLSSLGTPTFYLHPAEALHGDLGMVSENDILIIISQSGESEEVLEIIPSLKIIGCKIIGFTSNINSTLAKSCNLNQIFPKYTEACYLGLAPTSSTTAILCYGDALGIVLSKMKNFSKDDFGKFHPAGILGKKLLLRTADIMAKDNENSKILSSASLKDAIIEMSKKGLSIVTVVDKMDNILGVVTDGDIRRLLEKGKNIYELEIINQMTQTPIKISVDSLAIEALNLLTKHNITAMPVVEKNKVVGTITLQKILEKGLK